MKMRIPVNLISILLVLGGFRVVAAGGASTQEGKAAFEAAKCGMCHSVEEAGIKASVKIEAMKGPDLGGYSSSDQEVTAFLRQEADKDGRKHKGKFKGTDEELQAILKWLASLQSTP